MWLNPGQSSRSFTYPGGLTGLSEQSMRCHLAYYEEISETVRQQTALTPFPEGQAGREPGFSEEWTGQQDCQQNCQHHRDLTCILLHELYFETLAPGHACKKSSLFNEIAARSFQDVPEWKNNFIETALRRGIGWAVTLFEPETRRLFNHWIVGDEPDPALSRYKPVLVLDMWEHAYILDYTPSERLNYIGAFFQNINWGVIENRLIAS